MAEYRADLENFEPDADREPDVDDEDGGDDERADVRPDTMHRTGLPDDGPELHIPPNSAAATARPTIAGR